MKILQVTPRYSPNTGGVEEHVSRLSQELLDRGHEVTVLSTDRDGLPARETREGVPVRRRRALAPGDAFHLAPGVLSAVRRSDADLVHAHNYHSFPMTFAVAAADVPVVVTPHYHGGSASRLRDALLTCYRPVGGWALRRAADRIAVSEWERDLLAERFGVEATVIPNGVDVERFADAEPERRSRPYLLSVGRLVEYKGVQHLLRALDGLPDYDLLVAGSGPYRERLETLAADLGVADRVDFLGYVDADRLPALYAGAAAFVSLSTVEAYGMTVAEALAAGAPCVVLERRALTDWADRPDCVGISGTAPETVAAAVREAVSLSASPDELPTWSEVADRVEARYDGVLTAERGD